MQNFYFIAGASGSGKTSILTHLQKILGNKVSVYDFDDIGVPENADKKWRQESTEKWLQKLLQADKDIFLLGQMVLGEILACPSAKKLGLIKFCLLDVSDYQRIARLKKRNTYGADQNMLNWASWLRMHHQDPQWEQHVIRNNCWEDLDFSLWQDLRDWDRLAHVSIIDTTKQTIQETTNIVANLLQ